MQSTLLAQVRTKDEAAILLEELELLLESFYEHQGRGFETTLKSRIRAWVADLLRDDIGKSGKDPRDFIRELISKIKQANIVHLTISFEPTKRNIEVFSDFAKSQIKKDAILDISVEPDIIAGAIVIVDGKYVDFTFRNKFEEESENMRKELLGLLG